MNGFTSFAPPSSIEIVRILIFLPWNSVKALCTEGISALQIVHQVAQNRSSSTFPRKSPEWTVLPLRSARLNAGIAWRSCIAVKPPGSLPPGVAVFRAVQPAVAIPTDPARINSRLFIDVIPTPLYPTVPVIVENYFVHSRCNIRLTLSFLCRGANVDGNGDGPDPIPGF